MIPFPILSSTGVIPAPKIIKIVTTGVGWFTTSFILYDNGELWGVGYASQYWGVGSTGVKLDWVLMHSSTSNMWACGKGTLILTSDNKFLFSGESSVLGISGTDKTTWFDITPQINNRVPDPSAIKDIIVSSGISIHLNNGEVWVCGTNSYGAWGNIGSTINYGSMVRIALNVKKFMQNDIYGSAYINTSNDLYVCGQNTSGRFGSGNTNNYSTYTRIVSGTVIDFAITSSNSMLASSAYVPTNKVWSAGQQAVGQLGNGLTATLVVPTRQRSTVDFVYDDNLSLISSSYNNATSGEPISCVVKYNNKLYRSGRNSYGQFGNGSAAGSVVSEFVELPVIGDGDITSISTGDFHTMYVRNGILYGCGSFYGFPRAQVGTLNVMNFIKVLTPY